MTACRDTDIANPNAVEVVTDSSSRALYFSALPVPHDRDRSGVVRYFKHLGFYGYRKAQLDRFVALPGIHSGTRRAARTTALPGKLVAIHVAETPFDTVGVDTEEDVRRVEALLQCQ